VIERAVVLVSKDRIDADDLVLSSLSPSTESGELPAPILTYEPLTLADLEKRHIRATLKEEGWNKSRSAAILGIERSTLDRKIRRYELRPDSGN
jgi:Nif-specific regulatory protein